jgi:hypothetical protein
MTREVGNRKEVLVNLHDELLAGNFPAREEAAEILLPLLQCELSCRYDHVDPDILHDAVVDSIIHYLEHPALFDPAKGLALHSFVYREARQRLCNLVSSADHRKKRECRWAAEQALPEEQALTGNGPLAEERRPKALPAQLIQAAQTEEEQQCLRLMLAGDRDLCAFAKALGVTGADPAWQRHAVKRVKDRLKARLRRMMTGGEEIRAQLDQA